ncbi:solute carrier organic anion transporter family member 3A1-like isoform X1 [Asterias rubens]|uniref:solute carrier organic anion transporter family member 3A1-like isoform X1 n=1 Tax=Asterias rubens TaxID=7604 RepID=UPI0014554909|nr:solute carrier organic anion transporter family member 3A1-like isoform X1 [Asterias rubens]
MGFFNSPVAFGFCLTLFLVFQVSVGVYIAGALTTIEKQYRLTSSVSGIIISVSDFASLVSIMLVTYLGQHSHRPRIIGVLGLMTGLGGILSGVPHFLYPAYREGEVFTGAAAQNSSGATNPVFVCDASREEATCTADEIGNSGSRIEEMWALLLGQALMGFAYGPLFPLAITYIDDQVRGTTTPYYIGVFLSAGTTAPLIGFAQNFGFLQLFVNWPEKFDFMRQWIGAWWIGFILDGALILLISLPFFFFPKEMNLDIDESDIPEEKKRKEGQEIRGVGVKDFISSAKRIFTNFVWAMITLATCSELAVSACFGFFMPKFIEIQYNIAPALSALLVGIIIMPAALIGNLSSGVIVKKLKLDSRGCIWLLVFLQSVGSIFMPVVYFLSCPDTIYAGVGENGMIETTNDCNLDCECSSGRYEPVCGYDKLTYATPCFAACVGKAENQTADPMVNTTYYTGCECSAGSIDEDYARESTQGACIEPCNMLYYAMGVLFVNVLLGSCSKNPLLIVNMRCVDDADKTFALGVASLIGRAAGFLPAPLYIGALISSTCILQRIECGVTGDCLVYNSQQFRLIFLAVLFGLSLFSLMCFIFATIKTEMDVKTIKREKRDGGLIKNGLDVKQIEGADNKGYDMDMEVGTQTNLTAF